jgi:hypothetical protein
VNRAWSPLAIADITSVRKAAKASHAGTSIETCRPPAWPLSRHG